MRATAPQASHFPTLRKYPPALNQELKIGPFLLLKRTRRTVIPPFALLLSNLYFSHFPPPNPPNHPPPNIIFCGYSFLDSRFLKHKLRGSLDLLKTGSESEMFPGPPSRRFSLLPAILLFLTGPSFPRRFLTSGFQTLFGPSMARLVPSLPVHFPRRLPLSGRPPNAPRVFFSLHFRINSDTVTPLPRPILLAREVAFLLVHPSLF